MKITDVRAYVVNPSLPLIGSTTANPEHREWTFVEINTDEGIAGWGECTNYPGGGSFLTAHAVLACKEALEGEDPADIERLWHKLYRRYSYLGARGLPTSAISGIDIALWDIKGKALGRPVYDLLGGKFRTDVRLYANGWFTGCTTPQQYAKAAKNVMLKAGHTACKLDPFLEMRPFHTRYVDGQISAQGEQLGYDIVAAVREAVGPHHEILIDAHGHYNVGTAIRLANNLYDQSKIEWFEEPVPPESYEALRQVREHVRARICVGERLFTRYDFVLVLQNRLADYIMPDVVWTGGISELKKIATMAEAYYVPVSPHNAMGPLQIVAGAHVSMNIPNFYRLEHSMGAIPSYQKFLTEKLNFHDGCVTLNGKPGLGYDLDMDVLTANISPAWKAQGGTLPGRKVVARRSRRK